MATQKLRTWHDNLNNVIRDVIFPNEELLDLMLIKGEDRENITKFIDKYFVKDPVTDELVTDELVRICYYEDSGRSLGMNVNKKYLSFDIYVKRDELHTVGYDELKSRDEEIAQKLKELLTDEKYVCFIDFRFEDSFDLYTKVVGYKRYHITFSYKISF